MYNESPLVSVIVAVRNGEKTLPRCIESVANQTLISKELLIVDGLSTDRTIDVIRQHESSVAWWISESDSGIYAAWNKAVRRAKGRWICFLGADDYLWDSTALERIAPHLIQARPSLRLIYGRVTLVDETDRVLGHFGDIWNNLRGRFLEGRTFPIHQGMFHRKNVFESHGEFDESFRIAGDYEFLLRELKQNDALYVPQQVSAMRHGGVSSNPATKVMALRENMRARRKNGLGRPNARLLLAYCRAAAHAKLHRFLGPTVSAVIADAYRIATGKRPLWTLSGKKTDASGLRNRQDS